LFGGEFGADAAAEVTDLGLEAREDGIPIGTDPILGGADHFLDGVALGFGQLQFGLDATDGFDALPTWRAGRDAEARGIGGRRGGCWDEGRGLGGWLGRGLEETIPE
jgi:hypothetical protein